MLFLQVIIVAFVFVLKVSSQNNIGSSLNENLQNLQSSLPFGNLFSKPPAPFNRIVGTVATVTGCGTVIGTRMNSAGQRSSFYAFRGIRYAEPPTGNLRFQPPVPRRCNPLEIINATQEGNVCFQSLNDRNVVFGSEDCLVLNVYVPEVLFPRQLPVIFFVHGGAFVMGSGQYNYDGPDFLLDYNVIYVSTNYRVGALGFLATEDLVVPGNNGLKDQVLALKWVRDHIRAFGGDPNQITIMGSSAGAASVSYLSQSEQAKGLFKRAIILSGNTLCPWALQRQPRKYAFEIGAELGIHTNSSQVLISEMQRFSGEEVALAANKVYFFTDRPFDIAYAPVKEPIHPDSIFSDRSYRILSEDILNPEEILIGHNSLEGMAFIFTYNTSSYTDPDFMVPIDMNIKNEAVKVAVTDILFQHYFPNSSITIFNAAEFLTDDYFVRPTTKYVQLASKRNAIYAYDFTYMGILGFPLRFYNGVAHAEDQSYIFRHPNEPSPVPQSDTLTRNRWVKFIIEFATKGNPTPTPDPLFQNITWNLASESPNLTYLDFGPNLIVKDNYNTEVITFWDDLYDTYGNPPYDTY